MSVSEVESVVELRGSRRPRAEESSAAKALALLDVFSGPRAVLGVTELAQAVGLPKSTAHRLLATMVGSGFVRRVGTRYCLTERLFEVGNRGGSSAVRASGLRRQAMPYLAELYAGTRETVHLAMLSGVDVLYLEKLFGHNGGRCFTAVGARRPAYATALGKALLAFAPDEQRAAVLSQPLRQFTARTVRDADELEQELERVRSEGVAFDYGELHPDLHCVAAPIRDLQTGIAVAALSVCSARAQNLRRHGPLILDMARELSRAPRA